MTHIDFTAIATPPRKVCEHRRFTINRRLIVCADCDAVLDPYETAYYLAERFDLLEALARMRDQAAAQADQQLFQSRAAQRSAFLTGLSAGMWLCAVLAVVTFWLWGKL